jgi:hypothetical protein
MNIEDRSYLAWQAMDNISDMDVSLEQYAGAAAEGLGWRDLSKDVPIAGEVVVATDGIARWLDARTPWGFDLKWQGHTATHWHPIADLPPPPPHNCQREGHDD